MPSIPIRRLIPMLVVFPMLATVSLVGWLAFESEKQAVEELVFSITKQASSRIQLHLDDYLESPIHINELNQELTQSTLLGTADNTALEHNFWRQLGVFKIGYIGLAKPNGTLFAIERLDNGKMEIEEISPATSGQLHIFEVNDQGKREKRVKVEADYDFRQEAWYRDALKSKDARWSKIYHREDEPEMFAISAVHPIFDQKEQLIGVLRADHELNQLHEFLSDLVTKPAIETFIMERDGSLVASSANEFPFIQRNGKWERVKAVNSQTKLTQLIARHLNQEMGGVQSIVSDQQMKVNIEGQNHFIQVTPWKDDYGIDWLVVTVVPEAGFTKLVYENLRRNMLIGLGITALAALLGLIATPLITRPINRLTTAAKNIENGSFDSAGLQDLSNRKDEIGQLSRVIEEMASIIFDREKKLQSRLSQIQQEKDATKKAAALMQDKQRLQQLLWKSQRVRTVRTDQHQQIMSLLSSVVYFQSLSSAEIEKLLSVGYERVVQRGEVVCQEGELGNAFYIMLSGTVEVVAGDPPKFLRDQVAGEFFGELALLLGIPRTATVTAKVESLLFVLDQQSLQGLLQSNAQLADQIAQRIDQHQTDLKQHAEILQKSGLIENEMTLENHSSTWIRQRMKSLFNISFKQLV